MPSLDGLLGWEGRQLLPLPALQVREPWCSDCSSYRVEADLNAGAWYVVVRACEDEGSLVGLNQHGGLVLLKHSYREVAERVSMCLGFHRLHSHIPYDILLEPQKPIHLLGLVKPSS